MDATGDQLTSPQRQIYESVIPSLPQLWQRVVGGNLTLIHGDANASNILLPLNPVMHDALIIDWQLWGVSFAAEDLVHLMALFWNKEERQENEGDLLRSYHETLISKDVKQYSFDDCLNDYRLAVILRVLFMPMWFWKSGADAAWWKRSLVNAFQAYEDLNCQHLL
jgi:Ser/Thr protein kinase RdoA (MazF antagonist)